MSLICATEARGGNVYVRRTQKENNPSQYLWPSNEIPYLIEEGGFTPSELREINQAIGLWNKSGAAHLFPREPRNEDYVVFRKHPSACSSGLGRQGGQQYINCSASIIDVTSILHEIGHAIGLAHEHQRVDRDSFAVVASNDHNYAIRADTIAVGEYDCKSIMHYDNQEGRLTLRPDCKISRSGLSDGDVATANWLKRMSTKSGRDRRESCSRRFVKYTGSDEREVTIERGYSHTIPAVSTTHLKWVCEQPGRDRDSEESSIPAGHSSVVIVRYLDVDYFDLFRF